MTATEVLKLIDAGFTRDDILKLDADVKIVPDPKQQPTAPEANKEEPKPAPAPDKEQPAVIPNGVTLSDDQFKKLLQQLNVQGASLDVPPEQDMTAKLGEHFKDLMVGK